MNKHEIEGNWNIIKGKVKEQWGELTDDDVDQIEGEMDQLAGAIQKRYGRSLDEARKEINSWQCES